MQSKLLRAFQQSFWKFFLESSSLHPFVFLRISFAVLAIALWISLYPSIDILLGKEGYIEWFVSDMFFSNRSIPTLYKSLRWINQYGHVSSIQFIYILYLGYGCCLLMIGIGLFSNVFAFIAWVIHLVIFNTAVIYAYGLESFIHMLLFYFIFMPVDAECSLSALLFKRYWLRRKARSQVKARIFLRVLQIHLCIIYLDAGLSKMFGTHWWNGEAVWRSITQFPFNPFKLTFIHKFPLLLKVTGWLVLAFETLYSILIWHHQSRKIFLPCIIVMHACISFFIGLYFFGLIMIIMNLAAFAFDTRLKIAVA
ncbi:MAG: hypothetical protein LH478_04965 [Chitinophagaceae bacterium]|nr:hypothetical protein [Chitinophagaceae bacterium]